MRSQFDRRLVLGVPPPEAERVARFRHANASSGIAPLLPSQPLDIRRQLLGNLVGHVCARTPKLRAISLLRGGPHHVPVFLHPPHPPPGFVLPSVIIGTSR